MITPKHIPFTYQQTNLKRFAQVYASLTLWETTFEYLELAFFDLQSGFLHRAHVKPKVK